ncbi:Type IV Pilus-assembly protein W [compost metagenome]
MGNGIHALTPPQVQPAPTPAAGASAPADYALADNRYLVTDAGTQPMLSCRGMERNGKVNDIGSSQPLLANVERMRILYGVASRPSIELAATYDPLRHQIVGYLDAAGVDGLALSGALADPIEDRWGRVLSVRVCLQMRSDRPVSDVPAGGMAYKACDNSDATGTDGYLRKTYTTTVLLRNRLIAP